MFIQNKISISTLIGGADEIVTSLGAILETSTLGVQETEGNIISAETLGVQETEGQILSATTN